LGIYFYRTLPSPTEPLEVTSIFDQWFYIFLREPTRTDKQTDTRTEEKQHLFLRA